MSEVDVVVDRCGEQIAMAAETLGASMTMARPRGRLSSDSKRRQNHPAVRAG